MKNVEGECYAKDCFAHSVGSCGKFGSIAPVGADIPVGDTVHDEVAAKCEGGCDYGIWKSGSNGCCHEGMGC